MIFPSDVSPKMNQVMMNKRILSLAVFPMLAGVGHAAVVAQANFTGMTATDVTTSVGPSAGANDFTWSIFDSVSGVNMDIVTDDGSPGMGGGNALQMDIATTAGFRGLLGTMGTATTIEIGETLILTLDGRYVQTPGNNSGGMRLGFTTAAARDNAFFAQVGTGGSTAYIVGRDSTGDSSPGSGPVGTVTTLSSTSSGSTYATLSTSPFSIVFSVERTSADEYEIVSNVNGAIRTATSATGYSSFDSVFIRSGGISADLRVDNVSVNLIPEPGVGLLGALGALCLVRRKRR